MSTHSQTVTVKENVVSCILTACAQNHPGNHTRFGGRVGHIEWDLRHIREAHPQQWKDEFLIDMSCSTCQEPTNLNTDELIDKYHHYLVLCFAGIGDKHSQVSEDDPTGKDTHGIFSPDELEDFDTDKLLNLVAKETLPV